MTLAKFCSLAITNIQQTCKELSEFAGLQ